jgi:acyl-CoA dehydrogenase
MSVASADALTADQEVADLVAQAAQRIFDDRCTPDGLRAAEHSWSEMLWAELEAAGFTSAWRRDAGDSGVPDVAALALLRLAGRYGAPVPLAETLLAHRLNDLSGAAPLGAGVWTVGPVHGKSALILERVAQGWRVTGVAHRIPYGRYAKGLALVCAAEGQTYLVRVRRDDFGPMNEGENTGCEPRDSIRLDATLSPEAVTPIDLSAEAFLDMAAGLRVLQMTGALDTVLQMTVRYSQERQQFGRPLAQFQAIQQNVAMLAGHVAAARAAANSVVQILTAGQPLLGIAAAKLRVNEAAGIATGIAHQVHGAMGFTQDYPLHFATKRLWSWREEFGNDAQLGERIGRIACTRGPAGLWSMITSELT